MFGLGRILIAHSLLFNFTKQVVNLEHTANDKNKCRAKHNFAHGHGHDVGRIRTARGLANLPTLNEAYSPAISSTQHLHRFDSRKKCCSALSSFSKEVLLVI